MTEFDGNIIILVFVLTLFIVLFTIKLIKVQIVRFAIIIAVLSIFIYSGYGIAIPYVSNTYIVDYVVMLICFLLPMIYVFRGKNELYAPDNTFDCFIENNRNIVKTLAIIYMIMQILPMCYPSFRFFDVFSKGLTISGIYEKVNFDASDFIARFSKTMALFFAPFFYAYLIYLKECCNKKRMSFLLLLLMLSMPILDNCYISRSSMVYNFIFIYIFLFCIKNGRFAINKRQIATMLIFGLASVPFLYAYTFIRQGYKADDLHFVESINMLVSTEAYYPIYYDHILKTSNIYQGPLDFILWLLFLPIPSLIWPTKPTLYNDLFTYSITGLRKIDAGYSSYLPSFLGECFMYFGESFFGVEALIIGFVIAILFKYLCKSKYLLLLVIFYIIQLTSIGRAGVLGSVSGMINGSVSILILCWLNKQKYRH